MQLLSPFRETKVKLVNVAEYMHIGTSALVLPQYLANESKHAASRMLKARDA